MLVLSACTEPVHHGLSERAANEMVVVLEQHGIEAHKERDPAGDGQWLVAVGAGARVEAWRILQIEGLPRPETGGFGSFYPGSGLIPTAGEERVVLQYATAQELQKALLKLEGVVDAHVNLVLPPNKRVMMPGEVPERPRASVLVLYRAPEAGDGAAADAAPISAEAVRELVVGGVQGMHDEDVRVVMTPLVRSSAPLAEATTVQVGPLTVAPASKRPLQIFIVMMSALVVALATTTIYVVMRRNRDRSVA